MPQHYKIDTGFYYQDVYMVFAKDGKVASDYINDTFSDNVDRVDMSNDCRGFQFKSTFNNGKYMKARFYVFLHPTDLENTTVEHELIHLCWDILDHLGLKLSNKNHEAITYFYEYMHEQVKKLISEQIQRGNDIYHTTPQ